MNDTLLEIKNLTITIPAVSKINTPVKDVNLRIRRGETVALVGESGSGKSMTARSVLGLLPKVAQISSGQIRFNGKEITDLSQRSLRKIRGNRIGMIFQEPMNSLNPLHSIERQIGEVLRIHRGFTRQAARSRVLELLEMVGIDNPRHRLKSLPHELSGGQRQRIMLAMALANEPDLLIADEPTTALDVTVQRQVLELLSSLQHRLGMAILLISHDLGIVGELADVIHVMQAGSIVESGPGSTILSRPRHPYTLSLLGASTPPPVPDMSRKTTPPLIETKNIHVQFPLQRSLFGKVTRSLHAVSDLSFKLYRGDCLGVVGESGSGKSTLAKTILRLLPFNGSVRLDGRDIAPLSGKTLLPVRRRMQIVFQDPFASLNPRMTIGEIIAEGLKAQGRPSDKTGDTNPSAVISAGTTDEMVAQALKKVGLTPSMGQRYPHEFSGGQRQRIAIARAIVMGPDLLILDEPTSSLDRNLQFQILDLLGNLQQELDMAYLFITHDLKLVQGFCNRVMIMRQGRMVEEGNTREIFTSPSAPYTRELLAAAGL